MPEIKKRKNSKFYQYDVMVDGVRYRGSCQTGDKNLAEKIASTIKSDILRQKHDLPTKVNYNDKIFSEVWGEYMNSLTNSERTLENKKVDSNHFLPAFGNKSVKSITLTDIKEYQLNRKVEIDDKPKNANKRQAEITYKSINNEIGTLSNFFNNERLYIK